MKRNFIPQLDARLADRGAKHLNQTPFRIRVGVLMILLGASFTVQSAILQKDNVSALKATAGMSHGDLAIVEGYYSPGDRGGGNFKYMTNSTATPDDGRYIAPNSGPGRWVRLLNGETANVRMWGAKGNWHTWLDYYGTYAHDDTTNIQNALNSWSYGLDSDNDTPWASELLFPMGWYKVTDTLVWPPWAIKLRGERPDTVVIMASGIQKDILRSWRADEILKGQNPSDPSDLWVRIEDLSFMFNGWKTNQIANATNACLVISFPQEGNAIRNVTTFGGAYGIRCFGGGNGAPFALREVVTHHATIAGVSIEPRPAESVCYGHVSITGLTGDYFLGEPPNSASLVRFVDFAGIALIDDLNAEGCYGGGAIQHKFPSSGFGTASPMGILTIRNCWFNGGTGFYYNDFLVLKGGQRTASVSAHNLNLNIGGSLIRDEVTGRKVAPDVVVYGGNSQATARLPINYESLDDGATNGIVGKRSRLVIGQAAVHSFIPTNTGWYRIMAPIAGPIGLISGKLTIRSYYQEGAEVEVNVNPHGGSSSPWINVIRSSKYNSTYPPLVTKARAFSYWDGQWNGLWCGVDVYVANVITNSYREQEKRLIFSLPLDGVEGLDNGMQQLLSPTTPVSTGSGDTDGLPSGAYYTVADVVRL